MGGIDDFGVRALLCVAVCVVVCVCGIHWGCIEGRVSCHMLNTNQSLNSTVCLIICDGAATRWVRLFYGAILWVPYC